MVPGRFQPLVTLSGVSSAQVSTVREIQKESCWKLVSLLSFADTTLRESRSLWKFSGNPYSLGSTFNEGSVGIAGNY